MGDWRDRRRGGNRVQVSLRLLIIAALGILSAPLTGTAQSLDALVSECAKNNPIIYNTCVDGALAARGLIKDAGLLLAAGSDTPGSWGPLRRGSPRFDVFLRTSGFTTRIPELSRTSTLNLIEREVLLSSIQGSMVMGVFEGFQLKPTIGGLLALDLMAQGHFLLLPDIVETDGGMRALSLSARIGLVRETFTLPGMALSISRRFIKKMTVGWASTTHSTMLAVDPSVSSFRITMGKTVSAMGFMAGSGLDLYSSPVQLILSQQGGSQRDVEGELLHRRPVLFTGISLTLLILKLSTELGWAWAPTIPDGYGLEKTDAAKGSGFLSIAARLTLR